MLSFFRRLRRPLSLNGIEILILWGFFTSSPGSQLCCVISSIDLCVLYNGNIIVDLTVYKAWWLVHFLLTMNTLKNSSRMFKGGRCFLGAGGGTIVKSF